MTSLEFNTLSLPNPEKSYFWVRVKSWDLTKTISQLMVLTMLSLSFFFLGYIVYQTIFFITTGYAWTFFSLEWFAPDKFGIGNVLLATFWLISLTIFIVYVFNMFISIFISQFLSRDIKKYIVFLLQVLSGLPSVVFGFFVSFVLYQFFAMLDFPPKGMYLGIIVLVMMILPTTLVLTVQRLDSVSRSLINSGAALGLNRILIAFNIIYQSQHKKIIRIIFFGFTRAMNEMSAIALVTGNGFMGPLLSGGIHEFFFSSITTLSTLIGLEITEYHNEAHKSALFAVAFLMMVIIFVTNVIVFFLFERDSKTNVEKKLNSWLGQGWKKNLKLLNSSKWRSFYNKFVHYLRIVGIGIATFLFSLLLIWIVGDIFVRGILTFRFGALVSVVPENGGLLNVLTSTLILIMWSLLIAFPIALFVAIYLSEYSKSSSKISKLIWVVIYQLSGSPNIIFGLFGLVVFVTAFGLGFTLIAAAFTMILILLPLMIQTIYDNLAAVPSDQKNAAFALGLSKTTVIWKVVIPQAWSGILVSVIFGVNRVIAESAALLAILGSVNQFPSRGVMSSGRTLATHIYFLQTESTLNAAAASDYIAQTIFVVFFLILILNLFVLRFQPKIKKY